MLLTVEKSFAYDIILAMITKEKIDRINELARKAKTEEGLTEEETLERALLREEYIAAFRENLRAQLENIEFVEKDGTVHKAGAVRTSKKSDESSKLS